MRSLRHSHERPDLDRAQRTIDNALEKYPKSAFLHMVKANYCFAFLNQKMAFVYLDRMRHLDPSFDGRFYLYRKDTELKQKRHSESLGKEDSLDLVSYVEFQKNFKAARRFHNRAIKSIRAFWRLLLEDNVNVGELPKAFEAIDAAESKARYIPLPNIELTTSANTT